MPSPSHSLCADLTVVFIDEESCIGCAQCATVCPSSFLMLETGRARTFTQRKAPDVSVAVEVCPVNCMHKVSYHELKEMEEARDQGDGRSDHRHLGHRRGHTPLSVSGIDSDANHRSSWYHYLKQKCHSKLIACVVAGISLWISLIKIVAIPACIIISVLGLPQAWML